MQNEILQNGEFETEIFQQADNLTNNNGQAEVLNKKLIKRQKIQSRIWELDIIRGICVLLMVFDHIMFNFWYFYPSLISQTANPDFLTSLAVFARRYWNSGIREYTRHFILFLFYAVSGISSTFSRSNLKRGGKLLGVAYVVSFVFLFMSFDYFLKNGLVVDELIMFGTLHCLAFCMLTYGVMQKIKCDKIIPIIISILAVIGFTIFFRVSNFPLKNASWDATGITHKTYDRSMDYVPFLPYIAMFLTGVIVGKTMYKNRVTMFKFKELKLVTRPIKFAGRHALIIYVAHQVVMYGIYYMFTMSLGAVVIAGLYIGVVILYVQYIIRRIIKKH